MSAIIVFFFYFRICPYDGPYKKVGGPILRAGYARSVPPAFRRDHEAKQLAIINSLIISVMKSIHRYAYRLILINSVSTSSLVVITRELA